MRIIRFDVAMQMKNQYPALDWLTVALHSGYTDYQHLVKDYKQFTGCTPTDFFRLENQAPERFFGEVDA